LNDFAAIRRFERSRLLELDVQLPIVLVAEVDRVTIALR
jgi:hypothetical protein